ncbi:MAG TPA: hypothetical protein VJ276_00970 [Thermoanaerobaculia bacterium]|nr:hypothetical protein [Thermoanaerobaculia bacterium]
MKNLILAFAAVLLLGTCSAYKAQHTGTDKNTTRAEEQARQIPPTPNLLALFEEQPVGVKQAVLIWQLDKYVEELRSNGKYDCCVKPGCRECVIRAGECHCRKVINASGPCCGECTAAWVEGRGNTAGIDREKVLEHLGCTRELYEKKVPEGITPPGQPAKTQ